MINLIVAWHHRQKKEVMERKTVEYICLLPKTQYIHLILLSLIFFSYLRTQRSIHSTGIIIIIIIKPMLIFFMKSKFTHLRIKREPDNIF